MTRHKYDNEVGPDNAYGHALDLVRRYVDAAAGQVHLDLACGLAPIADLVEEHGLHYVGLDADLESVEAVRARGFEAHLIDLDGPDLAGALTAVLDGRALAAVTMLDGLEHLRHGERALQAIASVLRDHRAVGVLSVPNVSHLDVAAKLLLGQWQYTPTGLLDETHIRFYTADSLTNALREQGLSVVDAHDVVLEHSDQHVPADHVALSRDTPVGLFLRGLRQQADAHVTTNQFIWAVTADPVPAPPLSPAGTHDPASPFLSVLLRTSGRHPQSLREAMLCLAGQLDDDFEVLIVGHDLSTALEEQVTALLGDQPEGLRGRARLLSAPAGPPGAALNLALGEARGAYLTVLDERDLVLGSWVRTFHESAEVHPGRLLRTRSVAQAHVGVRVRGLDVVRADEAPRASTAATFSLWQHALHNQSPAATWACPATVPRDLGTRFDPDLPDGEDWEFLVRAAQLVGVADVGVVTSIQRHDTTTAAEPAGADAVRRVLDERPLLLPPGEARRIEAGLPEAPDLASLRAELARTQEELRLTHQHADNLETRARGLEEAVAAGSRRHEKQLRRLRRKLAEAEQSGVDSDPPPEDGGAEPGASSRLARGLRGFRPR